MEAKQVQHCNHCGAIHGSNNKFCTECGSSLDSFAAFNPSNRISHQAVKPQSFQSKGHVSVQSVVPQDQGPMCEQCQQIGVASTVFCIHCGSPYQAVKEEREQIHSSLLFDQNASSTNARAKLIMTDKSGTATQTFALNQNQIDIGSKEGEIILPNDPYVSARHARLVEKENQFIVQDLGSLNGVYQSIRSPWQLQHDDWIMIGQQVLRIELLAENEQCFQPASIHGIKVFGSPLNVFNVRLMQYTVEGIARDTHYLRKGVTTLGREGSDIVFHDDPYLSRQHAMLRNENQTVILEDMNSSNGTSLRIRGEQVLKHGDQLRIGKHLFRFETSFPS